MKIEKNENRILYSVPVSDFLARSALCNLMQLPSKIDRARIFRGAKRRVRCSMHKSATAVAAQPERGADVPDGILGQAWFQIKLHLASLCTTTLTHRELRSPR